MSATPSPDPAAALFARVWDELGLRLLADRHLAPPAHPVPLPSRLATADLAWASVSTATAAAGIRRSPDPDRVALSYRSDRALLVDGAVPTVWSPYSRFWQTGDGWIRTHGNYPHHARRLHAALRVDDPESMARVLQRMSAADATLAITSAGGLAVQVRHEQPRAHAALRTAPVLGVERAGDAPTARGIGTGPRPLEGVRVLDLTRVIAGPVATRALAQLGADVLRVDPPQLPEPEWQHLDTGHGKRTTVLDARSGAMRELLSRADVVVLGYRPAALERLGLDPMSLAERHPGLVIAQLSAWGAEQPDRAGFDSLVQAETGISFIESVDGETPGALPAQALDHSAGYLLAAAVIALLRRRAEEGGSWIVRTSLLRVAAELLGMPRRPEPPAAVEFDPSAHVAEFAVGSGSVVTVRPAIPGAEFAAPHAWGSDQPRW
ncbi:CoA transferase [Microbacterium sp. XT11]|uniref:CoA transferase n=1 Tax=Microbacterium sp. XT11 TaxID=367477 RepID=UPI000742E95C|nr:CoA transferase [Microbacterium sp. XT11]ALX67240.1 hypothetical protein AB663_003033 [Microbacterium sp. XT11]